MAQPGAAELYRAYHEAMERTPPEDVGPVRYAGGPGVEHYWFFRAAGDPGACALQVDPAYNGFMKPAE
ncbi:MAG TPA: hypothetical protein VNL77_20475 [Roseiflexaceae bacterium]|nr:hypothetical protein [Roseiflexaceae bacterium]